MLVAIILLTPILTARAKSFRAPVPVGLSLNPVLQPITDLPELAAPRYVKVVAGDVETRAIDELEEFFVLEDAFLKHGFGTSGGGRATTTHAHQELLLLLFLLEVAEVRIDLFETGTSLSQVIEESAKIVSSTRRRLLMHTAHAGKVLRAGARGFAQISRKQIESAGRSAGTDAMVGLFEAGLDDLVGSGGNSRNAAGIKKATLAGEIGGILGAKMYGELKSQVSNIWGTNLPAPGPNSFAPLPPDVNAKTRLIENRAHLNTLLKSWEQKHPALLALKSRTSVSGPARTDTDRDAYGLMAQIFPSFGLEEALREENEKMAANLKEMDGVD